METRASAPRALAPSQLRRIRRQMVFLVICGAFFYAKLVRIRYRAETSTNLMPERKCSDCSDDFCCILFTFLVVGKFVSLGNRNLRFHSAILFHSLHDNFTYEFSRDSKVVPK